MMQGYHPQQLAKCKYRRSTNTQHRKVEPCLSELNSQGAQMIWEGNGFMLAMIQCWSVQCVHLENTTDSVSPEDMMENIESFGSQ